MQQRIFEDDLFVRLQKNSLEEKEDQVIEYIEGQLSNPIEDLEEEKNASKLEKELMRKMGVRMDYEQDAMKKNTENLFSKF